MPNDKSKDAVASRRRGFKEKLSTSAQWNETGFASVHGVPSVPGSLQPVTINDLPPESKAILGMECESGDCLDQQPLCPPDPRITCQLVRDASNTTWVTGWFKLPWRVVNARKGDLIMCPGGSTGVIGGLLSQLSPPQHYTHMGIMTRDQVEIRHATASEEWLEDHPNGTIPLDGPEPTDGFEPDALRFGWPGTITQSIDTAYQASLDSNFPGALAKDQASEKSYVIHALGFDPTMVNASTVDAAVPRWIKLSALVVKPCHESTVVRDALHRIADEAMAIRGHYRFYSYSESAISEDPKFYGPPAFDNFSPDPKSPCNPWLPVDQSIPVVCSSLIWAALQRANAGSARPKLIVDSSHWRSGAQNLECPSHLDRHPEYGVPDPSSDGLYIYDEPQRLSAATALHEMLLTKVKSEIAQKIPGIIKDLGGVIIGVGAFLGMMSLPIGALVSLLGISLEKLNLIIQWATDMPDDVATQIVNAFASDFCETGAKDSDNWKTPGVGHAVSPDNIINCWSSPLPEADGGPDSREFLVGLYGYNTPVIMRPPQWLQKPITAWAISAGESRMTGQVMFNGKGVSGAIVKVCCRTTVTQSLVNRVLLSRSGVYDFAVPAGNYLASAGYEDPDTHVYLSDEVPVSVPFPGTLSVNFNLQPPPESNRQVEIDGHMDIVSRVAFGHDWWGHPEFSMPVVHVGPYGQPGTPDANLGQSASTSTSQDLSDYGSVQVHVSVEWQETTFAIKVSWDAGIYDGDDLKVSTSVKDFIIAQDGVYGWVIDLNTGGAWPDRAHIEFSVANNRQA